MPQVCTPHKKPAVGTVKVDVAPGHKAILPYCDMPGCETDAREVADLAKRSAEVRGARGWAGQGPAPMILQEIQRRSS